MTTLRTITGFKSALAGGGARPNLFEVSIPSFPTAAGTSTWSTTGDANEAGLFKFLCKAAALPASNVAPVDVPFRGRILKVAGERTFDTWTVTVINDENFKIRTAFEKWMNGISKLDNATGASNPSSYMADAFVYQLGRGAGTIESTTNSTSANGTNVQALRTYKFFDIFPTNISQIDLSYDTTDTLEEYTVEFQVQYWTAGASSNGETTDVTIS
jgi:hypothetical protein